MQTLKKVDVRSLQLKEAKSFNAKVAIGGAISLALGTVVFFAMVMISAFTSSSIKNAIPTDDLSANMTALINSTEEKQVSTFNILMIIPTLLAIGGLIAILASLWM